jgi:hypothetical protein
VTSPNAHRFIAILLALWIATLTLAAAMTSMAGAFPPADSQVLLAVSESHPAQEDLVRDDNPGFRLEDSEATESLPSAEAVPKEIAHVPGAGTDWWAAAQEYIRRDMYTLSPDTATPAGSPAYRGHNLAHNFDLTFDGAGVRVSPGVLKDEGGRQKVGGERVRTLDSSSMPQPSSSWTWGLRLTGSGYAGDIRPVGGPTPTLIDGNRFEYHYESVNQRIGEWYVNDERGLEQGFILNTPPQSATPALRAGASVRNPQSAIILELALVGDLTPLLSQDGQTIDFLTSGRVTVLRYAELHVHDARGLALPARLDVVQAADNVLRIIVDAADATYPITIDPIATSPSWTATGEVNSRFGISVGTAGDVNGDGYADVIVGAFWYNSSQGRAYVYYGGAGGLSTTPGVTYTGEAASNEFGYSVGTAGDVNGDGYADVIVGANGYNAYQGRAYMYLGGVGGLAATPAMTYTGETNSRFGHSVRTANDVNGDGYADIIVGADGYNSYQGRAYVYLGGAGGLGATPVVTFTGETVDDIFAYSVGTAGDVNGDGYADVVIGARGYNSYQGRAYVYYGGAGGPDTTPAVTYTGEYTNNYFGHSVGTAGDVNGDGYADVIVGAYGYSSFQGRVYVYYGGAGGLDATPAMTYTGETDSRFGIPVGTAGDVNGDGYADVIIGAYTYNSSQGRAYLYLGGAGGLGATSAVTYTGEAASNEFGRSVGTAGDVNGDGYSDIIVGADAYNSYQGRVYVYLGGADGPGATPTVAPIGEAVSNHFGNAVGTAGDVNGDGYADVIIGAYGYNYQQGRAYVYHGGAGGLSTTPAVVLTGQAASDFGSAVGTAGDVNGDGYADVIIGAYGYNSNQGRAYVYLGGAGGLSATPAVTLTGQATGNHFGWSVGTAGDVNGDGYADVIVGADGYNSNQGRAYVYHGGASGLGTTPAVTLTGEATSNHFGYSVGTAGDVNGDGYADVIVGAYGYNYEQGRASVYLGGAGGLSTTPAVNYTGEYNNDCFGVSVGSAGDINGDGYADVVVGAECYNSSQGRAYVYRGGAGGVNSTPVMTYTGETAGNGFGGMVGTAGDVNGDGYADVIIGAYGYSANLGRAYVYQGGAGGLGATPVVTYTGEAASYLGGAVGTAGDVNGDGYADVIVGAERYNSYQGRAYVYQGNGGAGLALRPRQLRADGSVNISPQGKSDSPTTVQLGLTGSTPWGRGKVKLQWQIAPLGTPFAATSGIINGTSATWTDVLTTGVVITHNVTGLTSDTPYHWRVRLVYRLDNSFGQHASRWLTIPWNGWNEADFRTAVMPPTSVTITGPAMGAVNTAYTFTATVSPVTATTPVTYTWTPAPDSGQGAATVRYTWAATGVKTIWVMAQNIGGAVTTTHGITISPQVVPLTRVTISGPMTGVTNTAYSFTANISPITATTPIMYTWMPEPDSGQGTTSTSYTWTTGGNKTITVTANNVGGTLTGVHTIAIGPWSIYLPLTMRDWINYYEGPWETEPNDTSVQANGPIRSDRIYNGTFPSPADLKDYFYFYLSTARTVELWLTNIPVGSDYDLYLRNANLEPICFSNNPSNADEHIVCGPLPVGYYYVQVYNYGMTGSTQPYHLRVVYR